jgi:four helix bundle protein
LKVEGSKLKDLLTMPDPTSVQSFEEMWIWQEARSLVKMVYEDFQVEGSAKKDFGFRDQIQRAAISVMNNIAEGFERSSQRDFIRFLDIAKASCGEVRSMYYIAEDLSYLESATADQRRQQARKIAKGIASLQRYLRSVIK